MREDRGVGLVCVCVSECVTSRHIFGGDSILSLARGWVAVIVPPPYIHEGGKNIPEKNGKWRSGRGKGEGDSIPGGGRRRREMGRRNRMGASSLNFRCCGKVARVAFRRRRRSNGRRGERKGRVQYPPPLLLLLFPFFSFGRC